MTPPVTRDLLAVGAAGQPVALTLELPSEGRPRGLVVVLHGFKGFKDWGFFPDLSLRLAGAGFAALRVGFSHNGTGRGADGDAFTRLDLFERDRVSYRLLDLQVARRAAYEADPSLADLPLALFGHSLGGGVALLSMKSLPVAALVTLASVDEMMFPPDQVAILRSKGRLLVHNARTGQMMPVGLAALLDLEAHQDEYDLDAAARLHGRPWLVLHGGEDPTVPVEAARRLARLPHDPPAVLRVIEGADHVMGCRHPFDGSTPHYETMVAETLAFLGRHLP